MTAELPRWAMRDPAEVVERLEEFRNRPTRKERAKRKLESLFQEADVGRKLDIEGYVSAALFQWGDWARRPNFWANLRITPFCRLLPIPQPGGNDRDWRLDPQSHAIHRAVMGLACTKTQAVLYAYYVAGCSWSDHESRFVAAGISKPTFYRLLASGSRMVFNAASVTNAQHVVPKRSCETICGGLE